MPVKPEWRRGRIIDTRPDADGDFWLLFANGALVRLKDGRNYEPRPNASFSEPRFLFRGHNELWVSRDGELAKLDHGELQPQAVSDQERGNVRTCYPSQNDALWVNMNGRIKKWRDGKIVTDLGREPWKPGYVTTMLEMRSGTLAFGTIDRGLFFIFPDGT